MSQIINFGFSSGEGTVTSLVAGNNISITGATPTINPTVNVAGTTQYAVQVGAANGALNSLALGTAGQVLTSNGAGVNPSFQNATAAVTSVTTTNSTAQFVLTGSTENINFGITNLVLGTNPTATITTATGNVGLGNLAMASLSSGQNNTVIGVSSGAALTSGSGNTAVGEAALNSLTTTNANTAIGQSTLINLLTGIQNVAIGASTGTAYSGAESNNICIGSLVTGTLGESGAIHIGTAAHQNSVYIAGITGVTVANQATVVVNTATGQLGQGNGAVNNWVIVTANQTLLNNTGHIIEGAGTETLALPVAANIGDVIRIASFTRQWIVTQAAGQQIFFGFQQTTFGAGGSMNSTNVGDCVEMVCVAANTAWVVISSIGNIAIN